MKKSKLNVNEILTKYQNISKTIPQQLQLNKILTKSRAAKLILAANFVTEFQMRHATRYEHLLGRPKHTHKRIRKRTNTNAHLQIPMHKIMIFALAVELLIGNPIYYSIVNLFRSHMPHN